MGSQTMQVMLPAASAGRLSFETHTETMVLPHISLRGQLGRHALLTGWSNSNCGAAGHQPHWDRGALQVQALSSAATEQGVEAKPAAPSHTLRAKQRRPCQVPDPPVQRSSAQEGEVSNRALNMLVRVRNCSVLILSANPGAACQPFAACTWWIATALLNPLSLPLLSCDGVGARCSQSSHQWWL